jgi:8-oxo-dGTP pyrophosphatase MutT (NUDIX family)
MTIKHNCVVLGSSVVACPRCNRDLRNKLIDIEALTVDCACGVVISEHFVASMLGGSFGALIDANTIQWAPMTPQEVIDLRTIQYPAVVAYIVRDDGLMLSVTRKDTGELSFPGGKCEPNESLHKALRREVREEVGLTPIHWHLVYDAHHMGRRVLAYRIIEWRGVPKAWEHGTRIAWVTPDVMANSFGAEYHRRALAAAGLIRA